MRYRDCRGAAAARAETLDALPAILTMARRMVISTCDGADPETHELKRLLEACVVGAHRLRLQEILRTKGVVTKDDNQEH